jgi:hypothetical protein
MPIIIRPGRDPGLFHYRLECVCEAIVLFGKTEVTTRQDYSPKNEPYTTSVLRCPTCKKDHSLDSMFVTKHEGPAVRPRARKPAPVYYRERDPSCEP